MRVTRQVRPVKTVSFALSLLSLCWSATHVSAQTLSPRRVATKTPERAGVTAARFDLSCSTAVAAMRDRLDSVRKSVSAFQAAHTQAKRKMASRGTVSQSDIAKIADQSRAIAAKMSSLRQSAELLRGACASDSTSPETSERR
jgi:hypothetical protein